MQCERKIGPRIAWLEATHCLQIKQHRNRSCGERKAKTRAKSSPDNCSMPLHCSSSMLTPYTSSHMHSKIVERDDHIPQRAHGTCMVYAAPSFGSYVVLHERVVVVVV